MFRLNFNRLKMLLKARVARECHRQGTAVKCSMSFLVLCVCVCLTIFFTKLVMSIVFSRLCLFILTLCSMCVHVCVSCLCKHIFTLNQGCIAVCATFWRKSLLLFNFGFITLTRSNIANSALLAPDDKFSL